MKQDQAFGALWIHGQDAMTFLDGQLTVNVASLEHQWLVGAYCSPQGKVIAIIWIMDWCIGDENGYLLMVANELLLSVQQRLQKYVMRSKVIIETLPINVNYASETDTCQREEGFAHANSFKTLSEEVGSIKLVGLDDGYLLIDLKGTSANENWSNTTQRLIKKGIPFIYSATSEQFVPQMLGLDTIGGVDFHKGCYVGQEVVARLHYKSQVRKHLSWAYAPNGLTEELTPGTNLFSDQRKAATLLTYAQGKESAIIQAVIQDNFIDKPIQLPENNHYQFIFTSARTSSQGV